MEDDTQSAKSIPGQDFQPAFIHSALDDYGLSMAQFRLFCHLSRRGADCYESVPHMAKACRMNDDTAWEALKFLEARRLIGRTRRPGHSSLLNVNPVMLWLPPDGKPWPLSPPTGKEGAGWNDVNAAHPSDSAGCHRKRGGDHPPEKRGHKGNPIEGHPEKYRGGTERVAFKKFSSPSLAQVRARLEFCANSDDWKERFPYLTPVELESAAQTYLNTFERKDWIDKDGQPIRHWASHCKAYAAGQIANLRRIKRH